MSYQAFPHIAFGELLTKPTYSIHELKTNLTDKFSTIQDIQQIEKSKLFYSKMHSLDLKTIKVMALSCTPLKMEIFSHNELNLLIPLSGSCHLSISGQDVEIKSHENAILLSPNCKHHVSTSKNSSILLLTITQDSLMETTKIMLGNNLPNIDFGSKLSHVIPLDSKGVSFNLSLRKLCSIIDTYQCSTKMLNMMSIDEFLYKIIATMLFSEHFLIDSIEKENTILQSSSEKMLKKLIDHTRINPNHIIAYCDMEKFMNVSGRSLQYIFKKHLNTTPTEWLRVQKLEYARSLLIDGQGTVNVAQASMEAGFTNFSHFAKYYKRHFGELPSETLEKVKLKFKSSNKGNA